VIDPFRYSFPDQDLFTDTRDGQACIDLLQANRGQLISAGVDADKINTVPLCTMCRTDLFFSYRREKNVQGKVGRLMSVIGRAGEKGNG
jgi:copper oxidase (laccase) domain-containing protein